MSSMLAPNPQTTSGTGGAQSIYAPPTDDPNFQIDPIQGEGVPQGYGLPQSAVLPSDSAPLGAFTDSQYLADDAALRAQIGQQYTPLLNQLGYMDPNTGNVIPGSVVQDANITLAQEQNAAQQALMGVVQNAQNNGTIFSGIRGTQTANALYPHTQNIAQIHLNTQRTLTDLYNQAQNLVTNYNTTNQQNLAAAAARNLASIQANNLSAPGGGGGGDTTSAGGGGTSSSDPNINYATSSTGQDMISQIQADPAEAGSSGAAQTLLAAGQGQTVPNYQAVRNTEGYSGTNLGLPTSPAHYATTPAPVIKPAAVVPNPRAGQTARNTTNYLGY